MHELSGIKELLLTLTMRSLPQVTIRPLDGSMSMWAMLCFPSWNVANAVRLHQAHTHTHTQRQHLIKVGPQYSENKGVIWAIPVKSREALDSLFFFDGIKAGIAHPHRELEAHDRERGAFRTAFSTHSLATLSAVVLHKGKTPKYYHDRWAEGLTASEDTGQTLLPVWAPGS